MADTGTRAVAAGTDEEPPGPPDAAAAGAGDAGADDGSMFRNAYALMLSTGVSAALGLGFWLVAAQYYSDESVGQGSAAIAAQRLIASLAATTMIGAVVRYVPLAGRATGPLVGKTYAVGAVVVTLGSVAFLSLLGVWAGPDSSYAPLLSPWTGLFFTVSCVAWAVLTLQDGVLTGLRKAFWVPVGNAVFSVGKLLLLVAMATALPVLGVFVSWSVAIVLSVLPLGWLVFRRLIPRQAAADRDREPPHLKEIGRFLAGDSVGALFSLAMINLLPVMVAAHFDPTHMAFFYTAYTVGGTMEFMAVNMASSLTAHASHSPEQLARGVRGALRRMTLLLVPVVGLLVVGAPYILTPFGPQYAEHGTSVLRLLALAALPRVAVELYIGVLRVQGRTGVLAALQGTMCVLVLGSAALLIGPFGIAGAGLAMVGSMTLVALACVPGLRAALKGRAADGTGNEEFGTSWARRRVEGPWTTDDEERAYGTQWAQDAAYLRGVHDTVTPAFGFPAVRELPAVREYAGHGGPPGPPSAPSGVLATASAAVSGDEEASLTAWLWLLLGLAAGLFWIPLSRLSHPERDRLSGAELIGTLPPVTLIAGVLLLVLHSAAVALERPRPGLIGCTLALTVAALHTAPLFLGVRPPAAGETVLADVVTGVAGFDGPQGVLRALPVVLQALCLALVAVALRALGVHWRVTASVVWALAVVGWVAQDAFAAAAVPVFLVVCAAAFGALLHEWFSTPPAPPE